MINPFIDYSNIGQINKDYPPLSLLYVSSLLKKAGFFYISLIDANIKKIKARSNFWNSLKSDIFIISSASLDRWQCPQIDFSFLEFKNILRKNNPDSYFFFIGPHNPKKHAKNEFFIKSNPEINVYNLINKFILKRKERVGTEINNLLLPDYSLVKNTNYTFPLFSGKFFLIETTRGCPYKCKFCNKLMYPKYIKKSIYQVKKELLSLHKLGIKNIMFIDLDFLIDKKFALKICNLLLSFNPKFRYFIQTRCDHLDKDILRKLNDSGCKLIQLGVESFSKDILSKMNKNQNILSIKNAFRLCRKYQIKTLAYMIVGFSSQKKEDINYDYSILKGLDPDYVSIVPFTDYKNSKICGMAESKLMTKRFYLRLKWMTKTIKNNNVLDLFMLLKSFIKYLINI